MRKIDTFLDTQVRLVELFLSEFCQVNEIPVEHLPRHVKIGSCPADFSIVVMAADDMREVIFGVRMTTNCVTKNDQPMLVMHHEIYGEDYLNNKDKYPKTTKAITEVHNETENCTGNTESASGE